VYPCAGLCFEPMGLSNDGKAVSSASSERQHGNLSSAVRCSCWISIGNKFLSTNARRMIVRRTADGELNAAPELT
jgi:hypothetical protein